MIFPKNLIISVLSENKDQIMLSDIIISITLFSSTKNNYHIGPFFSNDFGVIKIEEKQLTISANAALASGLMDYSRYEDCSNQVLVEVLDSNQVKKLINGRNVWGILGDESLLYGSKEKLLHRIQNSKNHLVEADKINLIFSGQDLIEAEIITRKKLRGTGQTKE